MGRQRVSLCMRGDCLGRSKCTECIRIYNNRYNSQLSNEERRLRDTRAFVNYGVRAGVIKRDKCLICGSPNSEAFNTDLENPLETVVWLCTRCRALLRNDLLILTPDEIDKLNEVLVEKGKAPIESRYNIQEIIQKNK
jgi:hypothetical protein